MADTKTSDETAATTPTGAELVRIVQSGSSKKTTAAVLGHQFRGARARLSSDDLTQNYTTAADIPFDVADFDTDGFWSAGSPTRLTIPVGAGITHVVVTGQVSVQATTISTFASATIRHFNSSGVQQHLIGQRGIDRGATGGTLNPSTGPIAVSAGDYFTMMFQEESDTSVTLDGTTTIQNFLALHVIGMEPV